MTCLLRDAEIEALLRASPSLIVDFDLNRLTNKETSPIKGSSLDLTVGEIFIPGAKAGELGGIGKPRTRVSLEVGQTAVLRSAEKLRLPPNIAGIGFPPSTKVSLAGLLSTNPGHVDPDYKGYLHLTVVNMGGAPFAIERRDRLMRLLLFKLSADTQHLMNETPSPLNEELLGRLSHDFLNIDERTKRAAKNEELRLRSWQVWGTVLTAMITGGLALGYQAWSSSNDVSSRVAKIEGHLESIEPINEAREIAILKDKIERLESSQRIPNVKPGNSP